MSHSREAYATGLAQSESGQLCRRARNSHGKRHARSSTVCPVIWYTAPTAIRMMMKDCADAARQFRYPDLRFIASMG